jgi:hypothetical protein
MLLHRQRRLQNAKDCRSLMVVADATLSWAALILVAVAALSPL